MTAAERAHALRVVGLRRAPDDVSMLVAGLDDPAPAVRAVACRALGWQRDPALAARLVPHFTDPDATVRLEAVRSLAVCIGRDGPLPPIALDALRAGLADGDPAVRAAAARVCGWLGAPVADALRAQLGDDPDPTVRAEAAHALGRLGDARAIPALLRALAAEHAGLRHHAARALGQLRADDAIDALRSGLTDGDPEVRVAALRATVSLTGDIAPISAALDDENPGVRATAAILAGPRPALPTARLSAAAAREAHPEVRGHLLRALILRADRTP